MSSLPEVRMEALEPRWLLSTLVDLSAATAAPDTFTWTDADADIISIQLEGTAGSALITSDDAAVANAGDLDDGEAIVSVAITGASSDFVMRFSVNSTTNVLTADGNVFLGDITSDRTILGLYTVADMTGGATPTSDFELGSFTGTTFSSGGGLSVDTISGSGGGVALVLTQGLADSRVINVSGGLTGDVTISRSFGGTISVGGGVGAGQWTLPSVLSSGFLGAVIGNFAADVTIQGNYSGLTTIDGEATGAWSIVGSVTRDGRLQAGTWSDLTVSRNVDGAILAVDSGGTHEGITAAIGGNLGSTARMISSDALELNITGSVNAGAVAAADSDGIIATVGRNFSGEFVSYTAITMGVGGSMTGGTLDASNDISLTVGGSMSNSRATTSDDLSADIGGAMNNSILFSGGDNISLALGGNMTGSTLIAGQGITAAIEGGVTNSVFEGSEEILTLDIGGNLRGSRVVSGSEHTSVSVGGSVTNSHISSLESDVSLDVGGSLTGSQVVAGTVAYVTVGGSMTSSRVEAASEASVDIAGNMTRSSVFNDESGDVSLEVGGNMTDSRAHSGSDNVLATIDGNMVRSSLLSGESNVTATVGGSMTDSYIGAEGNASVDITGGMQGSTVTSLDSDTELTVGRDMRDSEAFASDTVTADIGGNFLGSSLTSGNQATVTIGGNFGGAVQAFGGGRLTLTVRGTMRNGSSAMAGGNLVLDVGTLDGTVQANRLDLEVSGNVGRTATIQTAEVIDINADNNAFHVGGNFSGRLNVITQFDTGTGATASIVDGRVQRGAVFNIPGQFGIGASAAELTFGGPFQGEFNLGTSLEVDLTFLSSLTQATIGGAVNSTLTVGGALTFLSTGSLFTATSATGGNFVDGVGTTTGTLVTGGLGTVTPSSAVIGPAAAAPFAVLDLSGATVDPDVGTFTDAEGDIITIRLEGTSGTVTIVSDESVAANNLLDDGEEIVSIAITGASSDFVLSFSVDSTTNVGTSDGNVFLGDITSDRKILGIYQVADMTGGATPQSDFVLRSFTGVTFSRYGGISVDDISGSAAGDALVLTQGMPASTVINVDRGDLNGDVTMPGSFGGAINVGNYVGLPGDHWEFTGQVLSSGFLGIGDHFNADVTVDGNFAGIATIGREANGIWTIGGSVTKDGRLQASTDWDDVTVTRNFDGALASVETLSNGVTLDIGGNLGRAARVLNNSGGLDIDVNGNVTRGAVAGSYSAVTGTVGGNFSGRYANTAESMTLDIIGGMSGGRIDVYAELELTVGKNMTNSRVSNSGATIDIMGNMTRSTVFGGDSDVSLTLGGNMTSSTLSGGGGMSADIAGNVVGSFFEGSESSNSLDVTGDFRNSHVTSGSESVTAAIGGKVVNSTLSSLESTVDLTVGGSMTGSRVSALTDASVTIGGSMTNSVVEAGTEASVDISGDMVRSSVFGDESADVVLDVAGNMTNSRANSGSEDVSATIGGDMTRSMLFSGESEVTATVGGSMTSSTIVAYSGVSVGIGGSMTNSVAIVASDGVVVLSVGGNMTRSRALSPDSGVSLNVGGHFLRSHVIAEGDAIVNIGGDLGSLVSTHDGDVVLTVGGAILPGSAAVSSDNMTIKVVSLGGNLNADNIDLTVTGDVGRTASIQAAHMADHDADNDSFLVDGGFSGRLDVGTFETGTGASATLVAGAVSSGAKFNVTGAFGGAGAAEFVFGGPIDGQFNLGSDLDVDLVIQGRLRQGTIGGSVNSTITAQGHVDFLSTGSLFDALSATAGDFLFDPGFATGNLVAPLGFTDVLPTA